MTRNLVIYPQAQRDIEELADFIGKQNPNIGSKLIQAANETIQKLLAHPFWGSPFDSIEPQLRELRFAQIKGFSNHLIFYKINTKVLEIVRVLHGARNLEEILKAD